LQSRQIAASKLITVYFTGKLASRLTHLHSVFKQNVSLRKHNLLILW